MNNLEYSNGKIAKFMIKNKGRGLIWTSPDFKLIANANAHRILLAPGHFDSISHAFYSTLIEERKTKARSVVMPPVC